MPPKSEPCRNFIRGSCRYGDRCKFLHASQQQSKPNVFGFGSQNSAQYQRSNFQQQQSPNPFGFGVQSNYQSREVGIGLKSNQNKPFENKWTRSSANASTPPTRQQDSQQTAPNHICTDQESCKRQIIEDFQNEKPLWILTSYGHLKSGPCDVAGDISYEELRLAAYEDARRGANLQSIVGRERGLIRSKLAELECLVRNNSPAPSNSMFGSQSSLFGPSQNAPTSAHSPPSASSFGQLGALSPPSASSFGQLGAISPPSASSFGQLGALLNSGQSVPPNNTLQQSNPFPQMSFGNAGAFGSQFGAPSVHSPFTSSSATLNNGLTSEQSLGNAGLVNPKVPADLKDSIWGKEWKIGEIPEEAPPDEYVF
ncbi:unnamed protein product [Cuscuta epithymum]|uniref:C3H1-type domain-containing protein n=1 Tax=Cuscuta epithymum TaxID=186058 RepID=A0AAV0EZ23_9ASTE|nr:unnamed protein product [Cuscuta epithymum]